jgi:hypothetical protein
MCTRIFHSYPGFQSEGIFCDLNDSRTMWPTTIPAITSMPCTTKDFYVGNTNLTHGCVLQILPDVEKENTHKSSHLY